MNELFITMATWNVMLFTEFVTEPIDQYNFGWLFIWIMVTQISVNFFIVAVETVRILFLVVKKFWKRIPKCEPRP